MVLPADPAEKFNLSTSVPFLAMHAVPLLAVWTGVSWGDVALCVTLYFVRMFFVTAGYHRYFAHRSYRMPRWAQFLMAVGGTTAMQKGPLWWAAHHRDHHRHADTELDVHSPLKGFWWSHVGWILCDKYGSTDYGRIKDFAKYPELLWLNRHDQVPAFALAGVCFAFGGWSGLVVGFVLSTVLLWHGTFLVNSLAHVMGRRRYVTSDTSRNSLLIAVLTNGEGWHNNHHYYQASARQSFHWWQWDPSYYALWLLSKVGVVSGLKKPTARIVESNRIEDGHFDLGEFRARWHRAAERLASSGAHAWDALLERRAAVEARVEAAVHDAAEHMRAKRQAWDELAALWRDAGLSPLPSAG